jgi:siroheme synthase (precorrin-2 oxidase/ferrochelatase)
MAFSTVLPELLSAFSIDSLIDLIASSKSTTTPFLIPADWDTPTPIILGISSSGNNWAITVRVLDEPMSMPTMISFLDILEKIINLSSSQ